MLAGTLLVLGTWVVVGALVTGAGLVPALTSAPRAGAVAQLRASLWWGLGVATLVVLVVGLFVPLGSAEAGVLIGGLLLVLSGAGLLLLVRRRPLRLALRRPRGSVWMVLVSLLLMVVYLAYKTLGPATNYDTGLYHWGLIRYLSDFGNVPGLANLFLPFGYANAQFPLAATLTSGPWQAEGWRLLNGLIVVLISVELAWRLVERRWTWGTFTLLVGIAGVSLPLVAMADSLITSPTSDTSVLLLTLVSTAYLADVLDRSSVASRASHERLALNLGVVVIATGLTVSMRPTMLAYGFGVAVVVAAVMLGRASRRRPLRGVPTLALALPALWLLALGAVQVYRDYLLSGWLLYPLSVHSWDVAWLGRDPTPLRDATLAAARDPSATDGYAVAHSWDWIGAWVSRLPAQWEPWFLLTAGILLVVAVVWARQVGRFPARPRALALALLPGSLAVLAWFIASPPSFRFIWGPLFSLFFVILGAAIMAIQRAGRSVTVFLVGAAVVVLAVTSFSALFRNLGSDYTDAVEWSLGPIDVTYAVAPVPQVPTKPITMVTGLVIQEPVSGDQCWASYPLCTFSMGDRIGFLGEDIADGFVTAP